VEDVAYAARGFDNRTRHFTTWTRTLGRSSWTIYLFLLQQDTPVTYSALRSRFSDAPITALQTTLDALLYHGLIHCQGRGRRQRYSVAGKMYRDWFLSAGKLSAPEEQAEVLETPVGIQVLIERIEQHIGAQTNIDGGVEGPVASGNFESATAFGEGDAKDCREQEGD
jgi:DNA-binding transcriptional ArsR family regulator